MVTKAHSLDTSRKHVLLITSDVIGDRMAGPGIRFWEFSRALSRDFQVTLAVPPYLQVREKPRAPDFPARVRICRRSADLRRLVAEADVIVTLGAVVLMCPELARLEKPLVVDSYDPFMLAGLHLYAGASGERRKAVHERYRKAHLWALASADFILCASERQKDYWLGMLSALGRVNPFTHDDDPLLEHLLQIVPFGLPAEAPRYRRPVLKGVYPGIEPDDKVVIWGGGIWDWLDAQTAVKAMALIAKRRSDVKLFFMGTQRPNPMVAPMNAVEEVIALSRRLELTDRYVMFHDWVPYEDRQDYLLEADIGIGLHRDLLETRFAFRSRFLDYLWAGLPMVTTEGDVLSELVVGSQLGKVIPPGDEQGAMEAILGLLDTPNLKESYRPRLAEAAARYRWDVVTEPLVAFCREPRLAPDKSYLRTLPGRLSPKPWELGRRIAWNRFKETWVGRLVSRVLSRSRRAPGARA